jgi:hypothetical protein
VKETMSKDNFDALSKAAYSDDASLEQKDALWLALFKLEQWYFIARGNFPNLVPYIGEALQIEPNSLWIYAFTDDEKATNFAKENGLGAEDGSSLYFSVPVNRTTIPWILGYKDSDVKGVFFNANSDGFYTPLRQLQTIKDHLTASYPDHLKTND